MPMPMPHPAPDAVRVVPAGHQPPQHEHAPSPRARWGVLAVACLAQLMVVLDATIVNIALPTAQQALGFSTDARQWVVTAYALAFGSLLLVGGRLGDLAGRRTLFLVGLVGFAAASALGGAAGSFAVLVAARAAQGLFAALLAPAALSIVTTTFTDPDERARAFGIYGAIAGGGGAVGLLLGGALTQYLSWRWCLYVNVLIAVVALAGALVLLPRDRPADAASLDLPGAALSVVGLVCLVYGVAHAESGGWDSPTTLGFIGLGLAVLAVFVLVERTARDPLLPLSVLADRNRAGSYLAVGLVGAGMFGVFLFLTYYLATVMAYRPLGTGVAFLPMIVAMMLSSQVATGLSSRIGPKLPVAAGFLLASGGMVLLTRLDVDSTYARGVLPGLVVVGLGLGLVMAPAMSGATDRVDPEHAGVASAAVNTFQQIGGSIGTSVFSALAASAISDHLASHDPRDPAVQAQAAIHGYSTVYWWAAAVFAAGALVSALVLRHGAIARDPDAAPTFAH